MGDDFNNKRHFTYVSGLGFVSQTPQQYEKRHIIIQYNILIFSIILLCMLRNALLLPIIRFLSFIGFDITINPLTSMVTMSQTSVQVVSIIQLIMYMYIPALVLMRFNRKQCQFTNIMKTPIKYTTRFGIFIILGVSVIAKSIVFLLQESLNFVGILFSARALNPPNELGAFILFVLFLTIIPAFLEEFLFRGIIMKSLRFFGDFIAIVVSTILYTLIQPTFDTMVYAFIMGLAFAYFTVKSDSILVAFLANFVSKCSILIVHLVDFSSEINPQLFQYSIDFFILIASIIAFIMFIYKDKNAFKIHNGNTYLTNRAKLKYLFTCFSFWCLLGITVLTATSYIQIIG